MINNFSALLIAALLAGNPSAGLCEPNATRSAGSSSTPAALAPTMPNTPTSNAPAADGANSSPAPVPTNTTVDFGVQTPPPPLMGIITQEVAFTLEKNVVRRGPYVGVVVHLHNGTNSPLCFDGDRARIKVDNQTIDAIGDVQLEKTTAPTPSTKVEAKIGIANALTVGAASAIGDERVERGPILPRYGLDQKRREATSERFGLRVVWPGDETQGIVFFVTNQKLDSGKLEIPVVTFPALEVRGYLTAGR